MKPSRASKRRRRLVRTGTFAPGRREIENARGAQNLRKAAAARKRRRGRSSQTLQENRSPGEERSRGNSTDARRNGTPQGGMRSTAPTAKRDRRSHKTIRSAENSEGQAKLHERRAGERKRCPVSPDGTGLGVTTPGWTPQGASFGEGNRPERVRSVCERKSKVIPI